MAYIGSAPLTVNRGGTGAMTLTGVLTGNGTSAITGSSITDNTVVMGSTSNLVQDTTIKVTDDGEMTNASQPAFLAYQASTVSNATGDATFYTLGSTVDLTEVFDQNSDFDPTTGTFTAPIVGRYFLATNAFIFGGTAITTYDITLTTTNRKFRGRISMDAAAELSMITQPLSIITDMDLGDTATVTVVTVDTAGKVDEIYGDADMWTFFSGNLQT